MDGHYGDDTEDAVKEFKSYQYEDMLAYLEANPTPSPEPTPTPTPSPTPTVAPGEMPVVFDATLPPEPTATPAPTPYAPDGEITDSLLDFFKADSFDVYRQTVRNGDKGTEVERVQRRLHQLKYLYSADGTFGNLTENALKYFQRKNNLDQTGVADESTQRLLFSPNAIESEEYVFPYKLVAVSYTHLDVYKRQPCTPWPGRSRRWPTTTPFPNCRPRTRWTGTCLWVSRTWSN